MFLKSGADVVSPWHDVPLYADASGKVLNFICEIPKETKAKARRARGQRARSRAGRLHAAPHADVRASSSHPSCPDGGGHGRDAHAH